jgi:hypothetical protein
MSLRGKVVGNYELPLIREYRRRFSALQVENHTSAALGTHSNTPLGPQGTTMLECRAVVVLIFTSRDRDASVDPVKHTNTRPHQDI